MNLLLPAGLLAALLAIPILVMHMLRPRRPREIVSSLLLWGDSGRPMSANQPWQKFRWTLLLLLQLLIVAVFTFALMRPARVETTALAQHTVFIVDASGSMAAADGAPDRLGSAVDRLEELRAELPEGGTASVVVAAPRSAVVLEDDPDPRAFSRVIRRIRTSASHADFEGAFALSEALESPDRPTGFVLVSDGGLTELEQGTAPPGMRFESVGDQSMNRAITSLTVSSTRIGVNATVTVASTGGPAATQTLRVDLDGATVDEREVTIPKGGVVEEAFELPAGARVAAFLEGEDLLGSDNHRYAAATLAGVLKIRILGESTYFVEQLVAALGDVDVVLSPDEAVDLEVYSGVAVPAVPEVAFIAIFPPGGAPGITVFGEVDNPIPTLVADDPVLRDVDFSRIAIADAQLLDVAVGETILGAPGAPLIVRGEAGGIPFFYFAFTLERSNLPIDVSFPILGSRMVGALAGGEETATGITVGDPVPIGRLGGTVIDPRGTRQEVAPGDPAPIADLSGFWTIDPEDGEQRQVAANAAVIESALDPQPLPALPPASAADEGTFEAAPLARSLLPFVIAALIALLLIEIAVSWRSIGVGRFQWYMGVALRVVLIALVLLALVNPVFNRESGEVTTVFVVDVSDSLAAGGVDAAQSWVRSSLADRGDAQSAVVEMGSDALVAVPEGQLPYDEHAPVDPTATNLARGLRLARSMLDGETRERIIVVSDGRVTAGDLPAEIERLQDYGIAVDVHAVEADVVADAAVATVTAPNTVAVDAMYTVAVDIVATIAAQATVEIRDGDTLLELRTVSLSSGHNPIDFEVEAAEAGVQHLDVIVNTPGDAVEDNDSSFVAVEVEGPAQVLIVEGRAENGEVITEALESTGLAVVRVDVAGFPSVEELTAYQAVILLDVDARSFPAGHVENLGTFVSELGRGLIVVGGTQSYALGGYRDTELEALLPLYSELEDLQREANVAEVLVIDTSESMGACHCAPSGEGESNENDPFAGFEEVQGGARKTDIARSAAARAIQVLTANDEVGVLAFNGRQRWAIPLQALPAETVVREGLDSISPNGETRIRPALTEAAEALRDSTKELRHIILFTDGFTSELFDEGFDGTSSSGVDALISQAEDLVAEGITVSVVATGEGAIPALERIAQAGNGRFYPGRDLDEIPEIFVKEARLASRSFINENEYYPTVVSFSPAVGNLASSPPLRGFVATTPKPTADVQLEVGEFSDPLLASWRVGLGRVTSWTSDAGRRWAAEWTEWDGFTDFWSAVVRDTFALSGAQGHQLTATVDDDLLHITLEGSEAWPAGTAPVAHIAYPDGTSEEVSLARSSEFEFSTVAPAWDAGTYAVGVAVESGDQVTTMSALGARSFSTEYLPGETDLDLLVSMSNATGGRGVITARQAFDPEGLETGSHAKTYRWWFLLLAALLWPLDVAVRRIQLRRRDPELRSARRGLLRSTPT